jgi:hypothetical protein
MRSFKASGEFILTLSVTMGVLHGCRTSLRPETSARDLLTVDIQLTNMRDQDQNRPELMYTLSGCGAGSTSGTRGEDNIVQFQTQNLRKGDQCAVKVQSDQASVGPATWSAEDGLMYEARKVTITSTGGKLSGIAFLQQMYIPTLATTPGSTIWTMNAGVIAPRAMAAPCTCAITCDPGISANVASADIDASKLKALCQFANFAKPELAKLSCLKIQVQCGNDFYVGSWPAAIPVDGSSAKVQTLPDLILQAGTPEQTSDATIEVVVPR